MKLPRTALLLLTAWNCEAGEFRNLGFDQPEIPAGTGMQVPGQPSDGAPEEWMAPGWDVPNGVGYNFTQVFGSVSSLLDSTYRNTTQSSNPAKVPVVGAFALGIWPTALGGDFPFVLRQTGEVPADAQSLRFLYTGPGTFKVFVGGAERLVHFNSSQPSPDPEVPPFDYYVVDVGAFSGQMTELRFEFRSFGNPPIDGPPIPGLPDAKFHVLDDLSFSPLPAVPEPATWALLTVGLAIVFAGFPAVADRS